MKKFVFFVLLSFPLFLSGQENASVQKIRRLSFKEEPIEIPTPLNILPKKETTSKKGRRVKRTVVPDYPSGVFTQGALSVSGSGASNYTINIETPQGIRNIQPSISLVYNSQSANGIAGYGWHISGISVITRTGSTKYHDGNISSVDFSPNDRFILDGQRLILKSGEYGTDGATYQTENFSHLKIKSVGKSQYGAHHFEVLYPDGAKAYYGLTDDSRSALEYALSYWEDAQGVRITYHYFKSGNRSFIEKITYGKKQNQGDNEIRFSYKKRTRPEITYAGGLRFENSLLLDKIASYSAKKIYRVYQLNYANMHNSLGYDRLMSVQESLQDASNSYTEESIYKEDSKEPVYFSYNNTQSKITPRESTYDISLGKIANYNTNILPLDIDGDRLTDIALYPTKGDEAYKKIYLFDNFRNKKNNNLDFVFGVDIEPFTELFSGKILIGQDKTTYTDYDALFSVHNQNYEKIKFKAYVKGTFSPLSLQYEKEWELPHYYNENRCDEPYANNHLYTPYNDENKRSVSVKIVNGDFNGDGLADVLAIEQPYTIQYCHPSESEYDFNYNYFDHNARDDNNENNCQCEHYPSGGYAVHWIDLDRRKTTDFSYSAGSLSQKNENCQFIGIDVTGNGKTNLVQISDNEIFIYEFNQHNQLNLLWKYSHSRIKLGLKHPILGDYNGDGKIDFLLPTENNSSRFVMLYNTGKGFEAFEKDFPFEYKESFSYERKVNLNTSFWGNFSPRWVHYRIQHNYNLIATDINNDGKTDIIKTYAHYVSSPKNREDYQNTYLEVYENQAQGFAKTVKQEVPYSQYTPHIITSPSEKTEYFQDIIFISGNSFKTFYFNKDNMTDLRLSAVNEGLGISYQIHYDRLSERSFAYNLESPVYYAPTYQKGYREKYPYIDMDSIPWVYVVSRIEKNIAGMPTTQKQFKYTGGVSHLDGLGFLGFKTMGQSNWYELNKEQQDAIYTHSVFNPQLKGAVTATFVTENIDNYPEDREPYFVKSTIYKYEKQIDQNKVFQLKLIEKKHTDKISKTITNQLFSYDKDLNLTKEETLSGDTQKVIETTYLPKNEYPYLVGRVASKKVSSKIGADIFTTQQSFSYQDNLVISKKIIGHNTQAKTEKYFYDDVANLIKKETIAENGQSRIEQMQYDDSKRFLIKHIDFDGKTTRYEYDTHSGLLQQEINHLGQANTFYYDHWGREVRTHNYLYKGYRKKYQAINNQYVVSTTYDDGSYLNEIYNPIGLLIRTEKSLPVFKEAITEYQYDSQGRNIKKSDPYIIGGASWFTTNYDKYGRITNSTEPSGKKVEYSYQGLTTTVKQDSKITITTYNPLGQIIKQQDNGGIITYTYYGNGNLKSANYQGIIQSIKQDGWGRKTELNDPSAGRYTYSYDAWGRLTQQTTPKGQTSYSYQDNTNLLKQKHITGSGTDMLSTYTYDSNQLLTKLTLTNADGNNETYDYSYNSYHQLTSLIEKKLSGQIQFSRNYIYDDFGRIKTEFYLAQAYGKNWHEAIHREYRAGELIEIKNDRQQNIWRLDRVSPEGLPITVGKGNVQEQYEYGYNNHIRTHYLQGENASFSENYDFDPTKGLLKARTYSFNQEKETFSYDDLHRLTEWTQNTIQSQSYDHRGRIDQNSSLGKYTYNDNNYQQKSLITNEQGNQYYQKHSIPTITYNAFKSPTLIKAQKDGKTELISYQYDAFGARATSYYGGDQTDKNLRRFRKHYSHDGIFEIKYDQSKNKATLYLYLGGDAYSAPAVMISPEEFLRHYFYLYRDYLGSITLIADDSGRPIEQRHFDPWGNMTKYEFFRNKTIPEDGMLIDRGYTGHEHLLSAGLIHMNGRLYDPMLHRFLMPDNYVQDPFNTQNFNRYAYVLNNPLMYTDETGEFIFTALAAITGQWWALPMTIGADLGMWSGGSYANGTMNPFKWDYSSGNTWGYMAGGAIIGGLSGGVGGSIASSGIPMANTAGIAGASFVNSLGMNVLTGSDISVSFGVASYNFTKGEWGYLGKKGNSTLENIGYGLGALANISDILAGFKPGDVQLQTENTSTAEATDKIGHSQILDMDGNSLIDFGPGKGGEFYQFKQGRNNWISYAYDGAITQTKNIPGNLYTQGTTIKGVNVNRITSISNNLNKNPIFYNFALRSCSSVAARALTVSGVPMFGIHPYVLQLQATLWNVGIRPWTFSYFFNQQY